jgi:hypothetical protein
MKPRRPISIESLTRRVTRLDDASIDELYGLEPVFEPESPGRPAEATEFVSILCPYCWERFETRVDLTGGSRVCRRFCCAAADRADAR